MIATKITTDAGVSVEIRHEPKETSIPRGLFTPWERVMRVTDLNGHYVDVVLSPNDTKALRYLLKL